MIAYNIEELDNIQLHKDLDEAVEASALSSAEKDHINALYPVSLYTPNVFIRLGLFLLTIIVVVFTLGLVSLLFLEVIEHGIPGIMMIYGIIIYIALEYFVQQKKHYRSGLDDALIWMTGICFIIAFISLGNYSYSLATHSLAVFIIAFYFTLRFAHRLMCAIAFIALVSFFFFKFQQSGAFAKNIMPFAIMLFCIGIFYINKKLSTKKQLRHYENCLDVIKILCLIFFYAAGNYFVVREVGMLMHDIALPPSATIPFGWLFWIFTIFIPMVYIAWGVQKKDAIFLRVGLLLVAAVVFTVRYYHTIMPIEIFMVIAGSILIAGSYMLTRYLAEPMKGFTSHEGHVAFKDNFDVEAMIIAETFAPAQQSPDPKFGGGSFGGGGASGEF